MMKRKEIVGMCIGAVIGLAVSIWLFFPYDILSATIDAGLNRLLALVPPVAGGGFGYIAGTST
jgi:hypothetical protein